MPEPRTTSGLRGALARASRADGRWSSQRAVARLGWLPVALTLAAALLVGIAGLVWNSSPYYGRDDSISQSSLGDRNVGVVPVAGSYHSGADPVLLSPNRIVIPKLDAEAPVVDVGTGPNRELEIPQDPKTVGWWSPGAKPGATVGTAVLAGHINYAGVTGALSRIGTLNPGDTVRIYGKQNADARMVEFKVTAVRTYHKTALPFAEIFDQKAVGRIALVTCGGPFDASTGNYLDNVVVYAVPVTAT